MPACVGLRRIREFSVGQGAMVDEDKHIHHQQGIFEESHNASSPLSRRAAMTPRDHIGST